MYVVKIEREDGPSYYRFGNRIGAEEFYSGGSMRFRFVWDSILNRTLWEPRYPSVFGTPVRSMAYSCYTDMIAKGYRYEPAKAVHVPRNYLKVSPVVDFSEFRNITSLAVSGYTTNGLGELLALRMKMESGVEIEITPDVA